MKAPAEPVPRKRLFATRVKVRVVVEADDETQAWELGLRLCRDLSSLISHHMRVVGSAATEYSVELDRIEEVGK